MRLQTSAPAASGRSRFRRSHAGGLAVDHRVDLTAEQVVCAIDAHRANDARGRDACEKWGPGSSVSRAVLKGPAGAVDVAVKWNRWRGLRGALADGLGRSRAARALGGAERIAACGLASPETLAVAERRRFGLVLESFLVTRFQRGAEPLPAVVPCLAASARRELARRLGDLVGCLHAAGVDHPDLKHSNFLVGPGDALLFLDLDALVPPRRLTWRRRVRALGQLEAYARDLYPWLPRADRLRVLRSYLARNPRLAGRRRQLVIEVDAWARARLVAWSRRDRGEQRRFPLAPRPGGPAPSGGAGP